MSERIISYKFTTVKNLYNAYMPFIEKGGLFIPSRESFSLGEKVMLDILFLDHPKAYQIPGQVAWLTPAGAQGGKPQGVGVQFIGDDADKIRIQIETHLAGMLDSSISTDTM